MNPTHDPEFCEPRKKDKEVPFLSWKLRIPIRWWVLIVGILLMTLIGVDGYCHGMTVAHLGPLCCTYMGITMFWLLDWVFLGDEA